jgi:hypothetical protein
MRTRRFPSSGASGVADGARYQELARLRVADFNSDAGTLHIRKTKTNKDRHIVLTDEGESFSVGLPLGVLELLRCSVESGSRVNKLRSLAKHVSAPASIRL